MTEFSGSGSLDQGLNEGANPGSPPSGGGDMYRSTYDTDNDGVVDDSEGLGGQLPAYYATATDLATAYGAAQAAQAAITAHAALTNNPHSTTLEQARAAANAILGIISGSGLSSDNVLDLNNTDYGTPGAVLRSANGVIVVRDTQIMFTDASGTSGFIANIGTGLVQLFNDYGSFTLNADGTLTTSGSRLHGLPAPVATDEPVRLQELNTEVAAINAAMNTIGRVRGAIDFSSNPLLPASVRGDRWEASVAGLAGGALGQPMQVWDELVCLNDSPGGTWAAEGANFYIVQGNADQATELLLGMLKIATQILTNAETDDTTAVTPAKLGAWRIAKLGNVTNDAQLKIASNLSDLADAAIARNNLGLGNVDNTSDSNKPVSAAQQEALDTCSYNGRRIIESHHEMTGTNNTIEWTHTVAGTSAAWSVPSGGDRTLKTFGIIRLNLGTAATGRGSIISNSTGVDVLFTGLGELRYTYRFKLATLSDGTNTYVGRCGFIDSISAESTDAIYFRYTHSVNGGKWEAVTRRNSVETAVDTGISASTTDWRVFDIIVSADGTSVAFYIDLALVATITTNIPGDASRGFVAGMYFQRSAGTTTLNCVDSDFMSYKLTLTTNRW